MTRSVAAFIPARGGSKRVPGKNLKRIAGASLLERALLSAAPCSSRTVSTNDETIAEWAEYVGLDVHHRPDPLASDHAQIEAAVAHWWTRLDAKPDAVVILQPTSPFRTADHVREAVDLLWRTGADSVVSVTAGHEGHFAGRLKPRESEGAPDWYEWQPFRNVEETRPRTQDLRPMGTENGAIYACTLEHWERTGNRLGGRMVAFPMSRWAGMDVDTPEDLEMARAIAERMGM